MTQETKLTRHRAKQKKAGITRFSVQLDTEAISLLRNLCQKHGKTQGEFLGLAIMAADSLLAGRLQVGKPEVAARAIVLQRPVAPAQPTGNANELAAPESPATPPLRAAAFVVEL